MTGVIVTFQYDAGSFDRARIEGVAEGAKESFRDLPGLVLKAFTIDEPNHRAVNVYVWESEEAARGFFTDELRERVTGFHGVAPRIDLVVVAALVDNAAAGVGQ